MEETRGERRGGSGPGFGRERTEYSTDDGGSTILNCDRISLFNIIIYIYIYMYSKKKQETEYIQVAIGCADSKIPSGGRDRQGRGGGGAREGIHTIRSVAIPHLYIIVYRCLCILQYMEIKTK
jgi:hypothetical protein